ncbi:MAG TPA: cellulase family glycosylhydrolase, partial [Chitinophaga sp.]
MKKTILLLTFSFAIVVSLFAQAVSKHGSLRVNGTMLADEKGDPVMLRGMSYGWHCFWPRFYNAESVAWLKKDWKINVIRAAMGIEPGENSYLKRTEWSKEKMREVIDAAIKED